MSRGGRGSGSLASHTRLFLDLVPPPGFGERIMKYMMQEVHEHWGICMIFAFNHDLVCG